MPPSLLDEGCPNLSREKDHKNADHIMRQPTLAEIGRGGDDDYRCETKRLGFCWGKGLEKEREQAWLVPGQQAMETKDNEKLLYTAYFTHQNRSSIHSRTLAHVNTA